MALRQGKRVRLNSKTGEFNIDVAICDHRFDPRDTAEELNSMLKEHGLEIVEHPSDGDWYEFSIAKIKEEKR